MADKAPFDIWATYQALLVNKEVRPPRPPLRNQLIHVAVYPSRCNLGPLRACRGVRWYSLRRMTPRSQMTLLPAGTMFELVKALNDGARVLSQRSPNPISLNAGCELFVAFVTLFPHDSDVSGPPPNPTPLHSFKELLRSQDGTRQAGPEIRHRGPYLS